MITTEILQTPYPATSTENSIADAESNTSDSRGTTKILNFYGNVNGVAANIEGNLNIHPSESNSDKTDQ